MYVLHSGSALLIKRYKYDAYIHMYVDVWYMYILYIYMYVEVINL